MSSVKATIAWVLDAVLAVVGAGILTAGFVRARTRRRPRQPRLLWGTQPIITLRHLSQSMSGAGYHSEVVVTDLYAIYGAETFDHVLLPRATNPLKRHIELRLTAYRFLAHALADYDIFHFFFDSGLLRSTPLRDLEYPLIKAAGAKLVLFPYGSDAFVYDAIPNLMWRHGLMIDYPDLGDRSKKIERRVRHGTRYADTVIGCLVHVINLPRWDALPLTVYPGPTHELTPRLPTTDGTARIAHAANHRGFKGTDFLIRAVEQLRIEGHDVELDVIERTPNEEVLERIARADVYVDQLIAGYALAAIEAMALGKIVISPVGTGPEYEIFRHYSYLDECPIVPATVATIRDVLADLLARREEWPARGAASRAYAERRHSFEATVELFDAVYARIWRGQDIDLVNFYHPIEQARRTPGSRR